MRIADLEEALQQIRDLVTEWIADDSIDSYDVVHAADQIAEEALEGN